ncbi:MAG: DUF3179 domain-containing protein, partial [Betaproteobacteria bacterium]|nr:DUF3179 domain-containing protein [Betaproteobacteria bacterium]
MRKRNARTMTPVRRGAMLLAVALFAWSAAAQADPRWRGEWPRTDFAKRTVVLEEIVSGGPPRDGIPAIDRPRFVAAAEAGRWLDPREPVIVFEHRGEARAYPLQILMFHEIVNDTVGGAVLDFGTTGKLRKSDLVMYDRQTESWWQQFTGQGIVGRYAGATLTQLPATIVAFSEFRSAYP